MAGDVGGAVREFFKLLQDTIKGSEKRRMRAAIENAEKYIRRVNRSFKKTSEDKTLNKYEKRFWKYNN